MSKSALSCPCNIQNKSIDSQACLATVTEQKPEKEHQPVVFKDATEENKRNIDKHAWDAVSSFGIAFDALMDQKAKNNDWSRVRYD